jgi:hypothetical protein
VLDTLNELSAALGDDADFATSITNAIALKSDIGHSHAVSDVTGLQTALDGKANSASRLGRAGSLRPRITSRKPTG